jgi:septin family protein
MLQVDVCLYFIAAHRLKLIDIKFMQAISLTVAIIPVIAKADSYVLLLSWCLKGSITQQLSSCSITCVLREMYADTINMAVRFFLCCSMTTEETTAFRRHIMDKCVEHNIR